MRSPRHLRRLLPAAVVLIGCVSSRTNVAPERPAMETCKPGLPCWPTPAEWQRLAAGLTGRLEPSSSPLLACQTDAASEACAKRLANLKNPYFLQDQSGGTESAGWLDAWTAAPSAYAVVAKTSADVVAALAFAREHHLRIVVKGTGHDYLGRSNAPDSLLVWTHEMRDITIDDAFLAQGCPANQARLPAVTVGAGTRWVEAYEAVTVHHGRYVQGGGCASVGAAGGFIQGGGFGSWSKKYGTAASGMLEAEVVTADGQIRLANACQNTDLFWALRGGGGGTFGIVTRMTLMTQPLPSFFGWVNGTIGAKNDAAFRELLERFFRFYRESMSDEHWGEQVSVKGDNTLGVSLAFQGFTADEAERLWKPFTTWIDQHPETLTRDLHFDDVHADKMWSFELLKKFAPDAIRTDDRVGAPPRHYWWSGDSDQVSVYWYAYQSRWIPLDRFEGEEARRFAAALFDASRHWSIGFHFNKGQAGASPDAVRRGRETSVNPAVYDSAALIIVAAGGGGLPGVRGHEPNLVEARAQRDRVSAAMKAIRAATPGAGSYVNETDWFEPDWQRSFWGENYARLLSIKRKYDPDRVFVCHHCVGSEDVDTAP
jgi:FAD/FMN-containing dehydrogenase